MSDKALVEFLFDMVTDSGIFLTLGHDKDAVPKTLGTISEMVCGHRLARRMPPSSYMELIVTNDCNLRCSYCWIKGKDSHHMSEKTAFAAVDFLMKTSGKTNNLTILFFGGEPLLRFDLLRSVWEYATNCSKLLGKRISWNMTTNGTLMNEGIAQWCATHMVKYLLSMDGGRDTHDRFRRFPDGRGSYDVIAKKIPLMKRYQPWLGARMSVTPESCSLLRKGIEELHGLGINQFLIGYAHGIRWIKDDLVAYEAAMREVCELYLDMKYHKRHFRMTVFESGELGKTKRKTPFGCGAGRGRFSVDPYGDIHGCSKLANITGAGNGVLPLGNVFQGYTRIENRISLLNSSINPRKKCRNSEFQESCGGSCPAISYLHNRNIYHPDDLSCQHVFIGERINEYMRRRYDEIFGKKPCRKL